MHTFGKELKKTYVRRSMCPSCDMHTFGKGQKYVCTSVDVSIVRYAYFSTSYGKVVWWWCLRVVWWVILWVSLDEVLCECRYRVIQTKSSEMRAVQYLGILRAHRKKMYLGEETMINNITGRMVGFGCVGLGAAVFPESRLGGFVWVVV